MRKVFAAMLLAACLDASPAPAADTARDDMFLGLVKQRHLPPVDPRSWGEHVGADCVWVGRGLRVATRAEVQGMQIDTGKTVEIRDFVARDYGSVAVLTYVVVERQPQGGTTLTSYLRKMDTYLSKDGRWQLVANAEVVGKPDRKAVALDPATYDRYAGTYEATFNGRPLRTRFWRDGKRFMGQTEGQEAGELFPLGATTFFEAAQPEEGGPVDEFVVDAAGRVTGWIYRDGEFEVRARRVD